MGRERRKFKRFDAYMGVKYALQEGVPKTAIGLSRDLCREGIKLSTNEKLPTGTLVEMEIDIPDDPKPVSGTGEIMWTHKSRDEERGFDVGVKFVSIDPVDKFRVLDYAYNNWLETKINDFQDPERVPE